MNKFAIAFRKARLNSDKTFRELSDRVGKSIGYLSDIENGRRNPPEIAVIQEIEKFFGITDNHLCKLAKEHRQNLPPSISTIFKEKPYLRDVLYRVDKLPEDKLAKLLSSIEEGNEE